MVLYTKCIYEKISAFDGIRVSVMSRHTEDDGKNPDPNILEGVTFDEWEKKLGPPQKLIGAYYRGGKIWDPFENGYLAHIRSDEIKPLVENLARDAKTQDITVMCKELTPEHCHRRLLAEECKKHEPSLEIVLR